MPRIPQPLGAVRATQAAFLQAVKPNLWQTRLALTWSATERLHELLGQVLGQQKTRSQTGVSGPRVSDQSQVTARRAAGLPGFESADA